MLVMGGEHCIVMRRSMLFTVPVSGFSVVVDQIYCFECAYDQMWWTF